MRNYLSVMTILGLLVVALLAWINASRYADYRAYHGALARTSVQGVANEITRFVEQQERLVKVFADKNRALIRKAMRHTHNDDVLRQLEAEVADFFPHYFAVTISDNTGVPLFVDFEARIGELCEQDLRDFAKTGNQQQRIHPNNEAYHYDVLAPEEGILLVSFHVDGLGETLRAAQIPGHQLMLVYDQGSKLIEVTAEGPRINWIRDDYRLTAHEISRLLHQSPVAQTAWIALDLHEEDLFTAYALQLHSQLAVILLAFLMVFAVMLVFLRRAEKRRETAERHKDEFLSVISHELRTPLTVIRGVLALIVGGKAGEVGAKARDLCTRALNNTQRLTFLVDDLLDVRKIEAGKMEFNRTEVELKSFLEKCVNENRTYAEQNKATFVLHPVPSAAKVSIDETRMAQVLANLLSNAAKYGAAADTIDITVEETGKCYRVNVIDHGQGIPEEFRARVFSKFAQANAGNDRTVKGTGLGLYVVRLIVEHHGGSVGFTTRTGAGTTFYFELPMLA